MPKPWVLRSDIAKETGEMADGAGDELALTGQTGGANTTSEAASEQQIMLLQLQLEIAEAERERQRMELEIQRLQSQKSASLARLTAASRWAQKRTRIDG